MSTFTIDSDDPRTIRAITVAAGAASWVQHTSQDGHVSYSIHSQSGSEVYLADGHMCTCKDFARRQEPCKHVLAVCLHRVMLECTETQLSVISR